MLNKQSFLFLDECSYSQLDLKALTGVIVPLDVYVQVRHDMSILTWKALGKPPPDSFPSPIEFHASSLLNQLPENQTSENDQLRLEVLSGVVNLVNRYRLMVLRITYLNSKEIVKFFPGDPQLYKLCFMHMISHLENSLSNGLVIPVMDGVPSWTPGSKHPTIDPVLIRAFAEYVRYLHHARASEAVPQVAQTALKIIDNLAEPMFGDSSHSTMLQLVDVVSYLLLQTERKGQESVKVTEYRQRQIEVSMQIDKTLVHSTVVDRLPIF